MGAMRAPAALIPGMDPPWVIAHRGASADFPDNTRAAFDAALKAGPDAMELDLQRSRDGVAVVWHDRTLRKAGLPRRRVAGLTAAELSALDAGAWFGPAFAGARMPTLDEVLDRYGGRLTLMLEIKLRGGLRSARGHAVLAAEVARKVAERGLTDRTYLLSFGLYALKAALAAVPEARCVLNLDQAPRRFPAGWAPLAAVCINRKALTRRFVARAHQRAKPVLTFTCNTAEAVDRAVAAGVDGVISDRPGWLRRHLQTTEKAP
jgi:glycerophosphoryl diester phosphodiesterase